MASPSPKAFGDLDAGIEAAFQAAVAHQHAGHLQDAIAAYEAILAADERHFGARINLATALRAAGRLEDALVHYRVALDQDPTSGEAWFNAGNALRDLGRSEEAQTAYRQAIAHRPEIVGARFHLGNLLHDAGKKDEALQLWRSVLATKPDHAPTWRRVVRSLEGAGKTAMAEKTLMEAVGFAPKDAWLLRRLGDFRVAAEDAATAEALYRRAIAADPTTIDAYNGLGVVLASRGDLEGALASLERAMAVDPKHGPTLSNLATLNTRRGRLDLAIPQYKQALAIQPDMEEAATGLTKSLARIGACQEAVDVATAAVEKHPKSAECLQSLGFALTLQGRIAEALDAFARARDADPKHILSRLNAAFTSLYSDAFTAEEITAMHRDLVAGIEAIKEADGGLAAKTKDSAQTHPPASAVPQHSTPTDRLKIGYLGQDFKGHPVGYFIESALVHHNRDVVDVYCYADVSTPDAVTARMQALGHHWRDIYGRSVDQIEEAIRADGIDILIDLAGHTAGHSVLLLPRRPAPVQALYLGYPCTSGVAAMDYVISDALVSPPELAHLYTEMVMPIDGCFLCFRPYPDAPEVAPLPAQANGHVTFGCYNNLPKVSPSAIALWSKVLQAVPGSTMALKAPGLTDPPTAQRILDQFAANGIGPERVILYGITSPLSAFLAEYGRIDIALDSLPYVGGTTTCEALWMGVPVITLAGKHFYSRMGVSILTQVGLPNLVADTEDEFIRAAVDLSSDLDQLAALRAGLRARMAESPVCDGPGFATALEAAYRKMWAAHGG